MVFFVFNFFIIHSIFVYQAVPVNSFFFSILAKVPIPGKREKKFSSKGVSYGRNSIPSGKENKKM